MKEKEICKELCRNILIVREAREVDNGITCPDPHVLVSEEKKKKEICHHECTIYPWLF